MSFTKWHQITCLVRPTVQIPKIFKPCLAVFLTWKITEKIYLLSKKFIWLIRFESMYCPCRFHYTLFCSCFVLEVVHLMFCAVCIRHLFSFAFHFSLPAFPLAIKWTPCGLISTAAWGRILTWGTFVCTVCALRQKWSRVY